ncbi:MAG: TolC family protein [Candidatus Eremiobacter antarcticus]|nr:TolC family protein [Candidatus Eremiobacteraeota bacterium]MBC5807813.1 TolC family protein [Candidatus Eremiobacteraeota bacterium]
MPAPSPGPSMTLKQAVDFALAHNPSIVQAQAQAIAAAALLTRNRSGQLPQVAANAQSLLQRQSANNAGTFAQFGLQPTANFSQNTSQLLGTANVINFTSTLEARQAKRSYDAAVQNVRLTRQQTTLAVESGYYALVQDADLVKLANEDLAYQRTLRDIADANFRAGKVAGIDRLKAQVQLTSSQQRLASAQADVDDARQNLAQLIGAQPAQGFLLPTTVELPVLPSLDRAGLETLALSQRPEVAIAQANVDNARYANALVDAPNRPVVQLSGGWGNQTSPTANALAFDQCTLANQNLPLAVAPLNCSPGASHFYNVSLSSTWSLPLLDWGTVHAAHLSARATIDSNQANLDAARRQAVVDVDEALRRVEVQRQNLALAGANADIAKQVAQTSQVQYKVGLIGQIEVTAAQQTYLQAARDYLIAQIGYVLSAEKLKLATGSL